MVPTPEGAPPRAHRPNTFPQGTRCFALTLIKRNKMKCKLISNAPYLGVR